MADDIYDFGDEDVEDETEEDDYDHDYEPEVDDDENEIENSECAVCGRSEGDPVHG